MTLARIELSIDAQVVIEVAVSRNLSADEALYAQNIALGVPADDEELTELLTSIGGQTRLLEVLRKAISIYVTLPVE